MGTFPAKEAATLLADCQRHCCVCLRRCGFRIELHHIEPGDDSIDNALPFDCHAEIESKGPRGRHFTMDELLLLKQRWLTLCREQPELLIQAAQRQATETGPLEALLAELEYNVVVVGGAPDQAFPQLAAKQFDRAIATNAFSPLAGELRQELFTVYRLIHETNRLVEKLTHLTPDDARSAALLRSTDTVARQHRERLVVDLPPAVQHLASALGK
jgi:hypothetical protein